MYDTELKRLGNTIAYLETIGAIDDDYYDMVAKYEYESVMIEQDRVKHSIY